MSNLNLPKKTRKECIDAVRRLMHSCFDEQIVVDTNRFLEYHNQRNKFKAFLKSKGFCLLESNPLGPNESRYEICFFKQDECGFNDKKTVCYVRYVTGVFFGRIIQLTDELGAELDCIGKIR